MAAPWSRPDRARIGAQVYRFGGPKGIDELGELLPRLGVEISLAPLWWGEIETAPGVSDWSRLNWWEELERACGWIPDRLWTLYPIHMNERGPLPADLVDEPLDSPRLLERFRAFVTEAAARCGWDRDRAVVLVGNEMDLFARNHPDEVEPMVRFLRDAADAVHEAAPNARVCHAFSSEVLIDDAAAALVGEVAAGTDLAAFNWYDHEPDMTVRELRSLERTLARWRELAADDRPLVFPEMSLATSPACLSSAELQRRRVEEIFDVLGERSRTEIEGVCWLTIDDWPVDTLREWVRGQFPEMDGSETFLGFLTTLGLRTVDGTPKPGFDAWVRRAGERGPVGAAS